MSLLLRKGCQPLLDELDLEFLHVDIQNKCLCVVGECGQCIVTISGIKFNGTTPKTAEIEFAVELFQSFLTKHKDKLKEAIDAKKAFKLLEIPKIPEEYKSKYKSDGEFRNKELKYSYYCHDKSMSFEGKISPERLKIILQDVTMIESADAYWLELQAYQEQQKEVHKLISELQNCNI